jgi:GNAT superfamily N-acetyltransferase
VPAVTRRADARFHIPLLPIPKGTYPMPALPASHLTPAVGDHRLAPAPGRDTESPLEVRDLGPTDAHLLDVVHAGLSAQSRYTRYHGAKPRLTSSDRAVLAGTDGRDHVALVALEDGVAVGVARYVRDDADRACAEVAAEVVDRLQRRGLGSHLVRRLARRAAAAGIERFTATVLSEYGLPSALARGGWRVRSLDGPTATLETDVWTLLRHG